MINNRSYKHIWPAAAAAGLLVFAAPGCSIFKGAEKTQFQTAEVERTDLKQTVSATGTVQPLTVVDIKSRAGGEVKLLAVDVGAMVKPGQLIARIDPTDSQTTYNQAEADVRAGNARISQTQQTLSLQRQTTAASIQDARAQVRAAESRLAQAEAQSKAQPALTEAAIRQARASLTSAEQQLRQLRQATNPQATAEASTGLASAAATLRNAEQNLKRQQQLLAKGFVSQAEADAAETARDVAQANFEASQTRTSTVGAGQSATIAAAEARVAEARASVRSAEAQRVQNRLREQDVTNARAALAQARAGLTTALANQQQIGIRAADIDQARAQIARSQAALQNAQVQLSSTTIRAPRAGVILQKYLEQGTIIASGQSLTSEGTSIVQIGDLSRIFVNALVDEADVAQIKLGQKVNITLDAFPDEVFEGVVRRIDPRGATDQNITTILTQVEVLKPTSSLRPGLNTECEFIVTEKKDVLVVPARAVRSERGGRGGDAKGGDSKGGDAKGSDSKGGGPTKYVQVLDAENKPQRRVVTTGLESGDSIEIISGLKEGEKVVTGTIDPNAPKGKGGPPGGGGGPGGGGQGSNRGGGGFGGFGGGR
jgi:HlyD family secretion protein